MSRTAWMPITAGLAGAITVVVTGCSTQVPTVPTSAGSSALPASAEAAAYCVQVGGRLVVRQAVYGTNGVPSAAVRLGSRRTFCNFEASTGAQDTGFRSQIELDLESLYAEQPTLAILAYLEATPPDMTGQNPGGNPAAANCAQLGGTTHFGRLDDQAGGGWLKDAADTSTAFDQADLCAFPDGSLIDEWGITYHSGGAIRGIDLAKVVRAKPGSWPQVFGPVVPASPPPG